MGRRRTPEEASWLEANYPTTANAELVAAFERRFGRGLTASAVASWAHERGLRKARARVDWRGHPEYDDFLRGFAAGHGEREIVEAFERRFGIRLTSAQVGNAKTRIGVRSGTHGGRFAPGNVPANKGRTWDDLGIPESSRERMRATQFKRGGVPWTAQGKPVGYERVNRDGYVEVKVKDGAQGEANDNFRLKNRVVWERSNGRALRPGEVVLFADGDRRNFDPGNLVAVTQAENIGLNRIGRPYADRDTLLDALKVVRLEMAISRAERRPRRCATCGEAFVPRYARQRRCDACLSAPAATGREAVR